MIFSSIKLYQGGVPTTITPIYTAKVGETIIIKNVFVTNINEIEMSKFSLYVAKEGQTVDNTKAVIHNLNYNPGQKENINDLFLVLEAGDIIYVKQTLANALNIYVSGVSQQ